MCPCIHWYLAPKTISSLQCQVRVSKDSSPSDRDVAEIVVTPEPTAGPTSSRLSIRTASYPRRVPFDVKEHRGDRLHEHGRAESEHEQHSSYETTPRCSGWQGAPPAASSMHSTRPPLVYPRVSESNLVADAPGPVPRWALPLPQPILCGPFNCKQQGPVPVLENWLVQRASRHCVRVPPPLTCRARPPTLFQRAPLATRRRRIHRVNLTQAVPASQRPRAGCIPLRRHRRRRYTAAPGRVS